MKHNNDLPNRSFKNTTLGEILKDIRHYQQLNQKEVAAKANLHVSTLCKIERNASDPSLYALRRICFALQVELSEVFSIEEGMMP